MPCTSFLYCIASPIQMPSLSQASQRVCFSTKCIVLADWSSVSDPNSWEQVQGMSKKLLALMVISLTSRSLAAAQASRRGRSPAAQAARARFSSASHAARASASAAAPRASLSCTLYDVWSMWGFGDPKRAPKAARMGT